MIIKVTFPDGQSKSLIHGPHIDRDLIELGIPHNKVVPVMDHIWNFYAAYVDCGKDITAPPVTPTT